MVAEETTSVTNTSPNEILNLCFSELPEDLVVKILSKLPVKSLLRFKTVCKPWKLLLESPMFINIHLHIRNPPLVAIYTCKQHHPTEHLSQENDHSLSPLPVRKGSIVGACNGIICLKPSPPEKRLFLWNPSTRECSFIPDELKGRYYGFCYLPKTQDYKIICFRRQRSNKTVDMKILTLGKTKSLRHVKDVNVPGRITGVRKATLGTSFFWLGIDDDDANNEIVICYDAIEERFSKVNKPHSPDSHSSFRYLSILNDLVMMFVYPMKSATFFDIWILVDDVSKGKSWNKYRKIESLQTNTIMKPLVGIGGYGRSILCYKYTNDNYTSLKLFYYNLETDQVEDHAVNESLTLEIVNYFESLVSIKSLGLETTYY